jgi:hypothetical protein
MRGSSGTGSWGGDVSQTILLRSKKIACGLTFGTVSLNHGFGESSSANQAAVAEPASLARLRISHSGVWVSRGGGLGG